MALQLGALRDALLSADVPVDKANAASEEIADYGGRLTQLTTMTQVTIGILVLLLGSQAALWAKMGDLSGQQIATSTRLADITAKLIDVTGQQTVFAIKMAEVTAKLDHVSTQQNAFESKLAEVSAKLAEVGTQQAAFAAKLDQVSTQITRLKP